MGFLYFRVAKQNLTPVLFNKNSFSCLKKNEIRGKRAVRTVSWQWCNLYSWGCSLCALRCAVMHLIDLM